MNDEQENMIFKNEKLIYVVLKKLGLYAKKDDYYDLAMIGLIKGVKTFDNTLKVAQSTYLCKCIYNELMQNIRKIRPNAISLNTHIYENTILEDIIIDEMTNVEEECVKNIQIEAMVKAMDDLDEIEKTIIEHIFELNGKDKLTQKDLSRMFGLSQPQISRLKQRAILKLRKDIDD